VFFSGVVPSAGQTPGVTVTGQVVERDFSSQCLFIDEIKQFDVGILNSYNASGVERIEVYGKGRMIRVYTQRFVATNLGTSEKFPKIFFLAGGLGPDSCY